jgi:hypothetical protein
VSSDPNPKPQTYRIILSGRVSAEAKALFNRAADVGRGPQILNAFKEVHHLLSVYPQFGEPLKDLNVLGATIYTLAVPPLVIQYIIDETARTVFIGVPFKVLFNSGFE